MSENLMLDVGEANELKLAFRREGDWDNEMIKLLTERRGLLSQVLDVLQGRAQIVPITGEKLSAPLAPADVVILTIDYSQPLGTMIAAGRYDWTNSDITPKRFALEVGAEVRVEVEAKVFHFGKDISSEEAKRQIEAQGWEVAKIEHLLAYGATYPEEQRKFPIIALGSVAGVYGGRSVPYLDVYGSERRLRLNWWNDDWIGYYRFLAVRKKSQVSTT